MVALPLSPDEESSKSLLDGSSRGQKKAKVPRGVWLAGLLFALFLAAGLASRHEAVNAHLHAAGASLSAASAEGWKSVGGTWSAWTSAPGTVGEGTKGAAPPAGDAASADDILAVAAEPVSQQEEAAPAPELEEGSAPAEQQQQQQPPATEEQADADRPIIHTALAELDESLPVCQRTFLYEMSIPTGFAGQFVILSQAMTVASLYNYTLVVDDRLWNYGNWTDYFEPIQLDCRPPTGFLDMERVKVTASNPDFMKSDHVFGPVGITHLQEITISLTTNRTFLTEQHERDIAAYPPPLPLSGEDTIPPFFYNAFRTESSLLRGIWRPNAAVKQMIRTQREAFGWPAESVAKGQARERGDYIIGAHIRAGDKCHETVSVKATPLRFAGKGNHKTPAGVSCDDSRNAVHDDRSLIFFSAGAGEVNRAFDAAVPGAPANDSMLHWQQAAGERKPQYVIMSDNNHMKSLMEGHPNSGHWDLLQTENVDDPALNDGFIGGGFNSLTWERKVAATRPMVRDLTMLADEADGLVFTATSNVGRVFALLAGFDKARKGMLRSADMRWYPTSHFYKR